MEIDDMVLVSVDDHIVEPPNMTAFFEDRVPAKYKSRVPRVVRRADGADAWLVEGQEILTFGLNAVQGRPREEWGEDPANFDEVRPGCYDVHERIRDMNANGVLASLNFPTWPGLGGQFFAQSDDEEYVGAMIRAYNDWHIEEWCGPYPGRFIPLALSGFTLGGEWMAQEIRRVTEKGCHAISFHPETYRFGAPDLHGDEWDAAWQACVDTDTVMVYHFGGRPNLMPRTPFETFTHSMPFQTAIFAAELLWSPIMHKFPDAKIALAEGGIGWVPYFLEKADFVYEHHRRWTGADFGTMLPSQAFRRQVLTCFIDDVTGLRNRDAIGVEHISWECDYPHSDSTWPQSPETLMKALTAATLSDEEIHMITWKNACSFYGFNPFEVRSIEQCTVGALRAQADEEGVDVSPRHYGSSPARGRERLDSRSVSRFLQQSSVEFKEDE
jgi:predicted TIM-barrel fold metal-dependent hydrolase